ncbi:MULTISPECIES: HrpE/YscL family type III secretion apparatus protein [Candidatus Williamhamiltonella]|uniref:HrpE/YscL family type III secretion apparatus protein n=1 Tax=Candidatus Williamhamiltonella TaxID=568987 RepID=UPI001314B87C|nr:HrpE/YscL family type III secretion apparatus protein [Candidatus Hamiltonella defensa]
MSKKIPNLSPLSAREGVLLTYAQIQQHKRAKNILNEAYRNAKKIIRQAEEDAEKIQKQAYMDGYQQGVMSAIKHIVGYMNNTKNLMHQLNLDLEDHARQIFSTALDHPDILIVLLDEWLNTLPSQNEGSQSVLHLIFPEKSKKKHADLLHFLNEKWNHPIKIEYHPASRFVIKYQDQIAEFIPEEFMELAVKRLLLTQDTMKACRQLSQGSLEQLFDYFKTHLPEQGTQNEADELKP